jgi:hypothetical protein
MGTRLLYWILTGPSFAMPSGLCALYVQDFSNKHHRSHFSSKCAPKRVEVTVTKRYMHAYIILKWNRKAGLRSIPSVPESRRIGATSCAAGMVCSHPPRQIYRDLGPWTIFSPSSLGHSYTGEEISEMTWGPGPSSARPHLDIPAERNRSVRGTKGPGPSSARPHLDIPAERNRSVRDTKGHWTIFSPSSLGHSCREEQLVRVTKGPEPSSARPHLDTPTQRNWSVRGTKGPGPSSARPIALGHSFTGEQIMHWEELGALDHLQTVLTQILLHLGTNQWEGLGALDHRKTSYSIILFHRRTVAKFVVPDWGHIADSGKGLSYRPASLCSLAGWYDNQSQLYP